MRRGMSDPTPAALWTIDLTVPETTIEAGPEGVTNDANATFAFSSGDPTAVFEVPERRRSIRRAPLRRPTRTLRTAHHSFSVRARDTAGNVNELPAARGWTVDAVAPVVAITSPGSRARRRTTPAFSGSAGAGVGTGAVVTIRVHAGATVAGTFFADVRRQLRVRRDVGGAAAHARRRRLHGPLGTARHREQHRLQRHDDLLVDTQEPGAAIIEKPPDPTAGGVPRHSRCEQRIGGDVQVQPRRRRVRDLPRTADLPGHLRDGTSSQVNATRPKRKRRRQCNPCLDSRSADGASSSTGTARPRRRTGR